MSFLKREKKRSFLSDTREKLEQVGIFGVHDDQLDKRLGAIQKLHEKLVAEFESDEPEKQVEELYDRLIQLDLCLRQSGVPWTEHKDALKAWERLVSYAKEGINITKSSIAPDKQLGVTTKLTFDKSEIVDMLRSFLEVEVFPYGLMIIDHSYRDKHVSPSFNVVIQNQQPYGFTTAYPREFATSDLGEPEYTQPTSKRVKEEEEPKNE